MSNTFHIVLQGRPSALAADAEGRLAVRKDQLALPLACTFDDAYAKLAELDKLFIEPDGAFLWTGWDRSLDPPNELWRLDGCLYDSGPRLQYVELKGHSGAEPWARFLAALNANDDNTMIQFVESGQFRTLSVFASEFVRTG